MDARQVGQERSSPEEERKKETGTNWIPALSRKGRGCNKFNLVHSAHRRYNFEIIRVLVTAAATYLCTWLFERMIGEHGHV